jgi:hypothetical protein
MFPLPVAAEAANHQARGARADEAVGGAAGFDPRIANVFGREKQLQAFGKSTAYAQVRDCDGPKSKLVFIVFELPAEKPGARHHREAARCFQPRSQRRRVARHLGQSPTHQSGCERGAGHEGFIVEVVTGDCCQRERPPPGGEFDAANA